MSTGTLATMVIAVCLVGFILYRQVTERPVSQRGMALPALLGALASRRLSRHRTGSGG
jgi:hypothetical protein